MLDLKWNNNLYINRNEIANPSIFTFSFSFFNHFLQRDDLHNKTPRGHVLYFL